MSSVRISTLKAEQLESYLVSLTPAAARFLIREVELDRLKGGNSYDHDLVLKYARHALQMQGSHFERVGTPLRLLCEPFADILVDSTTARKQGGRISRSSILPMWRWLTEDVAPERFAEMDRDLSLALLNEDRERIQHLTGQLHAMAAEKIAAALRGLGPDTKPYFRMVSQLGSARIVEDVLDIAGFLEKAPLLLEIRERLPAHIESLGREETAAAFAYYKQISDRTPEDAHLLLLILASRLRRPSEVLRIVTVIARSEKDADIRQTPMAMVCECLLHDMEVAALGALQAIGSRAPIALTRKFLAHFFEIAEAFVGLMDVDMKGVWGQRIVAIRNALSTNIRIEIESGPRLVKAALYGNRRRPLGPSATTVARPDQKAIEDAEYTVRLMLAVRPYLSQIPINAEFASIQSTVLSFIESVGEITIEDIRRSDGEERGGIEAYMSAIADFNELVFGAETAELLRRRARAAAQQKTGS